MMLGRPERLTSRPTTTTPMRLAQMHTPPNARA